MCNWNKQLLTDCTFFFLSFSFPPSFSCLPLSLSLYRSLSLFTRRGASWTDVAAANKSPDDAAPLSDTRPAEKLRCFTVKPQACNRSGWTPPPPTSSPPPLWPEATASSLAPQGREIKSVAVTLTHVAGSFQGRESLTAPGRFWRTRSRCGSVCGSLIVYKEETPQDDLKVACDVIYVSVMSKFMNQFPKKRENAKQNIYIFSFSLWLPENQLLMMSQTAALTLQL